MSRSYIIFIDHSNNVVISQTGTPKKIRAHSSVLPLLVRGVLARLLSSMVDIDRSNNSVGYSAPVNTTGSEELDHWFDGEVLAKAEKLTLSRIPRSQAFLETGRVLTKPVDWNGFMENDFNEHPTAYIQGV